MRRGALGFFALVLAAGSAHAQKPTSQHTEYSPYEAETLKNALDTYGLKIDHAPAGKTVERIDVVALEVLEKRDPIPENVVGINPRKILNSLHYVTRDSIIRREVLVHEGDPYDQVLVDETERNMRARMPLQISVVVIQPVEGSTPDKVRVLVIVKDIWSLRLSYNLAVTSGGLEDLLIVPQETNLLGLQHTASLRFEYQPESLTFGTSYNIPRFGTSWIGAGAGANIFYNRRSLTPEGSSMSLNVGQPLYSTLTDWAWSVNGSYAIGVARRYVNAHLAEFDSPTTPQADDIPTEYKSRSATASAALTRSFGWRLKNNFGLSMNAVSSSYDGINLNQYAPAAAADFQSRFIPVGETRVYPALTWSTFENDYLRTLDINTLALQEDYRLGHNVSVTVYPVAKALGSTRDILGVSATAGYTIPMGDGLVGASVNTLAEDSDGTVTDGAVGGSFGVVTPRFGIGRLVANASFINRYRNYLNAHTFLGGGDRLRGYPSNFFFGKDAVFYNVEYRSRAIEILKLQLAGVLFYDVGDAAATWAQLNAKQSVGFGLRFLIPQLNRLVVRADLGFPIERGPFPETGITTPVDPFGFAITVDQAFSP